MYIFLFYFIGVYTPIILFIFSIIILCYNKYLLYFFIISSIFNILINCILKILIKQSRPIQLKTQKNFLEKPNNQLTGPNKYGMPSGHAQFCGFTTSYIYFTNSYNYLYIFTFLLFSLICVVQRVFYKNHTILQVYIGYIIGICIGYSSFIFFQKYIN